MSRMELCLPGGRHRHAWTAHTTDAPAALSILRVCVSAAGLLLLAILVVQRSFQLLMRAPQVKPDAHWHRFIIKGVHSVQCVHFSA